MRFFKSFPSFPRLHRRSKSDSSIPKPTPAQDHNLQRPQSLDAARAAVFAAAVPACPQTFLFPTPSDASNAIFELQTANARLHNDVCAWAADCTRLRTELDATRADLFRQLYQTACYERQAQSDKLAIEKLQDKLAQYERFLGLMINVGLHQRVLGDAHTALRAGVDPDLALVESIKDAAANSDSPWSSILLGVTGPRTQDEYKSALNMTLKARKELKDNKKVAKFWKRVAQEASQNQIVTPSVSTISSIHEPLSAERQKAVEELISARRSSLQSTTKEFIDDKAVVSVTHRTSSTRESVTDITASTSSTSTSSSTSLTVTPCGSAAELHCLSPLASESFKTEMASVSSKTRIFKRAPPPLKQSRPVLGQIDMNIPSQLSGKQSAKFLGKQKAISTDLENALQGAVVPDTSFFESRVRARELSVPTNVAPSFSKHSLCSNLLLGPLGRIEEEREELTMSVNGLEPGNVSQDSGNSSQESNWCLLDFPDHDFSLSFGDAALSTAPTTPEKISTEVGTATPTKTSRLPKPVAKQLNRLSLRTGKKSSDVPSLRVAKKSAGGPLTTRLPMSVQGKRTMVRA